MSTAHDPRDTVITRYSGLARTAATGGAPIDTPDETEVAGCGASAYAGPEVDVPEGAIRASLACGNPVAVADLHPGDTVLDIGSGAGLDVILSARRVGPAGCVYGLDASQDMLALARAHADEAGIDNVIFLHGFLEAIPLPAGAVDVVISNCVLNLSVDKPRALSEIHRVLRPGGRLGISDVIATDDVDPARRAAAEHAIGCSVGTLTDIEYRDQLDAAGFTQVAITSSHPLTDGLDSAIIQAHKPPGRVG